MKPEQTRYRATTQVKELSLVIPVIPVADAVHLAAGETLTTVKQGRARLAGSETVARYQTERPGTRETPNVLKRVRPAKSQKGKVVQMTLWESDKPIVARKPVKAGGAKGLTSKRRDLRDRTAGLRTGARFSTKLKSLTLRARQNPDNQFNSLLHLVTEEFLLACFGDLKRSKAPGIDAVTVSDYEVNLRDNIRGLVQRLKARRYRPQPALRVYVPKPNGDKRPLGLPAVEDKLVQMACKRILEAIYEVDFLDISYGFRPQKSAHDALDALDRIIMTQPINYVVDLDIEKFFDTVDHTELIEWLKRRIADSAFLRLIERFLKAGVISEGHYIATDRGTPQGSVLSPVLANIYLHYTLDSWFEHEFRPGLTGYAQITRYADDFVVCFENEDEAKRFTGELRQRLSEYKLRIAENKSRLIEFGQEPWERAQREGRRLATFDFLGFTHYCEATRAGQFKLGRKTARQRLRRALTVMSEWLSGIRNRMKIREWWPLLVAKLEGYYRYYGISGNMRSLASYCWRVIGLTYKWLNRRSQRKSYNWARFRRWLTYHPLPKPKIYHSYPILWRMPT